MKLYRRFLEWLTPKKIALILIVFGIVIYANSLGNNFVGDDSGQIVGNTNAHSIKNLPSFFTGSTFGDGGKNVIGNYYKPILTTFLSLIYSVSGANPFMFHLFQVVLHIINSILLFYVFYYFFRKDVALIGSLIFLVHPINVESVAYVSALQEPLFLFFGLLALRLTQTDFPKKYYQHLIVAILLLLSALSKETGLLFLLILPLFQKLFHNKWKSSVIQSTAVFLIYIFFRVIVGHVPLFHPTITTVLPLANSTLFQRIINIPQIIFFYISTFLFPKKLLFDQIWVIKSISFNTFYLPLILDLLFAILLVYSAILVYRKNNNIFKVFVFFSIWLIIGLGLHLQLIPLDATVSDRWFYFPIIGLLGISGSLLSVFINKEKLVWTTVVIVMFVIGIFSVRTIIRNENWHDSTKLYQHDLNIDPDNWVMQEGLCAELISAGDLGDAITHATISIELRPNNNTSWTCLGFAYEQLKQFDEAKDAYLKALTYNGDDITAYGGLINIMVITNQNPKDTATFIKKGLDKSPDNPLFWLLLAVEDYKAGNKDEALMAAEKSFNIYPDQQTKDIYTKIVNNQPVEVNLD